MGDGNRDGRGRLRTGGDSPSPSADERHATRCRHRGRLRPRRSPGARPGPCRPTPATRRAPRTAEEAEASQWSFSAFVYTYIVPDDQDFRAAHGDGGPRLAASRSALQLRGPGDGLGVGGLQLLRWRGARVGVHTHARWGGRRHHRPRARLQSVARLVEARVLQRGRIRLRHQATPRGASSTPGRS